VPTAGLLSVLFSHWRRTGRARARSVHPRLL
jgi:hypothetical protein